jgi:hypothetical protein
MHVSIAVRPLLWGKVYPGIPPSPITAETVPGNRLALEGHDLVMVEVGHADTDDNSVLHVPGLALVVAGDVIYNRVHMYLGQSTTGSGPGARRSTRSRPSSPGISSPSADHLRVTADVPAAG